MHYAKIIASLVAFSGLAMAIPNSYDNPFPLVRRGEERECIECPPEERDCVTGCIYIVCEKQKCKDKDCCEKLGLEDGKPYVLKHPYPLV